MDIQIEVIKSHVVTKNLAPGANLETWTLIKYLQLAIEKSKRTYDNYDVSEPLSLIIAYTKKYPDLANYERDMIIEEIRKFDIKEYQHYIQEIKDNLKLKE